MYKMCLYAIIHIQFTNKYMYMYLECMLIFYWSYKTASSKKKGIFFCFVHWCISKVKTEVWQITAHRPNPACLLFLFILYIIFYWNTATLTHSCTFCGCRWGSWVGVKGTDELKTWPFTMWPIVEEVCWPLV